MKNVALFVGNDIFSWLVCRDLIAALKGECAFTVYFPLAKAPGARRSRRFAAWGCMSAKC